MMDIDGGNIGLYVFLAVKNQNNKTKMFCSCFVGIHCKSYNNIIFPITCLVFFSCVVPFTNLCTTAFIYYCSGCYHFAATAIYISCRRYPEDVWASINCQPFLFVVHAATYPGSGAIQHNACWHIVYYDFVILILL